MTVKIDSVEPIPHSITLFYLFTTPAFCGPHRERRAEYMAGNICTSGTLPAFEYASAILESRST
jgi:hypothetical protein